MYSQTDIEHLISLISKIPFIGVIITSKEGYIEYVSDVFTKMSGYTLEEVVGKTPNILKSGVHPESFYKILWDTISSNQIFTSTVCNKSKDGREYWQKISIIPITENGVIIKYAGFLFDVTYFRSSELKLGAILSVLPDIITTWDNKRVITEILPKEISQIYPRFWNMLGKTLEESNIYPQELINEVNVCLDFVDSNPTETYRFIHEVSTEEKGVRVFESSYQRYNSDKYISISRDITDVVNKTQEVNLLLNSFPESIFIIDNTGRILQTHLSPLGLARIFTEKDFNGKMLEEAWGDIGNDVASGFGIAIENLKKGSMIEHLQFEIDIDDKRATFEISISDYPRDRYLVIVRDITDSRQIKMLSDFKNSLKNLVESNTALFNKFKV